MELKYKVETPTFAELKDKITIPRFQRGLKWKKKKQHEFIKTLKAGLPIGILLLYPDGDKYQVVDGLQRYTTMLYYTQNYFEFVDKEEITDNDLESIVRASKDAKATYDASIPTAQRKYYGDMREIVSKGIQGRKTGENLLDIARRITENLCKEIAMLPKTDENPIIDAVYRIVDREEKQATIDNIKIPVIYFVGDKSDLPAIFKRLNQEGVKLSNYDVYAATWINDFVTIKNDPMFIKYVTRKYKKVQDDSDLEIADYDPDKLEKTGKLTVFEYAFAVGKELKEKCKLLFPNVKDDEVDSIGFLLLTEIMGLQYKNMGNLAGVMTSHKNLDYKQLKDAIVNIGKEIEQVLEEYITAPTKKKVSLACHAEYQIASYIIVLFKLKYNLNPGSGIVASSNNKIVNGIKQNLPKHYLFDIIGDFWSGSGDSKLEQIIANPMNCRYTRDVAREEFETAIQSYLEKENSKTSLKIISVQDKLFLNYLLRKRKFNISGVVYDVEHCVPRDVIKKYYEAKGILVPMSPVCNIVYIPATDNQSKGEKTYYQRQSEKPGAFTLNQKQLDDLAYPTRTELNFVESTDTLTKANYDLFLKNRKEFITNKMIERLYGNG